MMFLECFRVSVYVPQEALEQFIAAVSVHIPSFLGGYDHVCWWSEAGCEQFRKKPNGAVERVACHRFECALPYDAAHLEEFIERVIRPNHPWQEPVIVVTEQKIANVSEI